MARPLSSPYKSFTAIGSRRGSRSPCKTRPRPWRTRSQHALRQQGSAHRIRVKRPSESMSDRWRRWERSSQLAEYSTTWPRGSEGFSALRWRGLHLGSLVTAPRSPGLSPRVSRIMQPPKRTIATGSSQPGPLQSSSSSSYGPIHRLAVTSRPPFRPRISGSAFQSRDGWFSPTRRRLRRDPRPLQTTSRAEQSRTRTTGGSGCFPRFASFSCRGGRPRVGWPLI